MNHALADGNPVAPPALKIRLARLRRTATWVLAAAGGVYVVGLVVAVGARGLPWPDAPALLPLVFLLAPANWAVRFLRWRFMSTRLHLEVPPNDNLAVYLAGLGLTVTPAKVGELVRSWLLWERHGIPAATTVPMTLIDRVADGCALVVLLSLVWTPSRAGMAAMLVAAAGVAAAGSRPVGAAIIRLMERVPLTRHLAGRGQAFLDSARTLLDWRPLGIALLCGLVGWSLEGLVPAVALAAFGFRLPVGVGIGIFAAASLGGILTPGGLGVTDGGLLALLLARGVPVAEGAAAVVLIRVATLWSGVLTGLFYLGWLGAHPHRIGERAAVVSSGQP